MNMNNQNFVIALDFLKPKTWCKTWCFFFNYAIFGDVFEQPMRLMFLTMFFKVQNIVQMMHRTMLIAHPKVVSTLVVVAM